MFQSSNPYFYLTNTLYMNFFTTTFPDNFRSSCPEVFFEIAVLKYLRKFTRKHPRWSVFVSNTKKNILTWKFFWKFYRIFQNNYFASHFRVAVFLIHQVSWLNDSHLFFWIQMCFLSIFQFGQLLVNCLALTQKNLCGGYSRHVYLFAFNEKIFLCLVGSYY